MQIERGNPVNFIKKALIRNTYRVRRLGIRQSVVAGVVDLSPEALGSFDSGTVLAVLAVASDAALLIFEHRQQELIQ